MAPRVQWTPIIALSGSGVPVTSPEPLDLAHAAAGSRRNGLPEVRPYAWRPGDADREAEIQARVAAVRAAAEVARRRWKQALADEKRAKRNRRGRRPAPVITGLRVDPRRQP